MKIATKQKQTAINYTAKENPPIYSFLKRILDLVISLTTVLLLSPLLIFLFIALKLTGEGEIFYWQKRIGLKNKYFQICKFATMLKNSPNMGSGSITLRDDPRVTPVGKYLRITKVNELPQVFNVIRGDMSIVGPRPLVDKTFDAYPEEMKPFIYNSKPGITGIGSIIFRDEEKLISESDMPPHEFYQKHVAPYKGALEMWYQENKSIFTDIKLIFLTAWVILFSESDLPHKLLKDLPKKEI